MDANAVTETPFTLWLETLPTGDTARVLIRPDGSDVRAIFYWNQQVHTERRFTTRAEAEAWGYEFHHVLQADALAGVLLGYDGDVLNRLQLRCSL